MNRLVPFNVPWMISPSLPNLRLTAEDGGRAAVQFFGLIAFEPPLAAQASESFPSLGTSGLSLDPSRKEGRYQLITLHFKNAGWIAREPQYSDREVIQESRFDWSQVQGRISPNETAGEWQQRCLKTWAETRVAPNPSAYLVENSEWKREEAERWGLRHYLILGDESSLNILAEAVEWVSEGAILGW